VRYVTFVPDSIHTNLIPYLFNVHIFSFQSLSNGNMFHSFVTSNRLMTYFISFLENQKTLFLFIYINICTTVILFYVLLFITISFLFFVFIWLWTNSKFVHFTLAGLAGLILFLFYFFVICFFLLFLLLCTCEICEMRKKSKKSPPFVCFLFLVSG